MCRRVVEKPIALIVSLAVHDNVDTTIRKETVVRATRVELDVQG